MSRKKCIRPDWGRLMPLAEAKEIIGGELSITTKMPGYSYNLSAHDCIVGSILRKIKGSTCEKCYAFRGHYTFPVVQEAMARRLRAIEHPRWVPAMATMINWWSQYIPYFRWHDSGDIQSIQHLDNINEVAKLTPIIQHWLPTREVARCATIKPTTNLCIRISEAMIDKRSLKNKQNTSGVVSKGSKTYWENLVKFNNTKLFFCPAILQAGQFKNCRACWQKEIRHVVYPQK